jgi:hypothetical protein
MEHQWLPTGGCCSRLLPGLDSGGLHRVSTAVSTLCATLKLWTDLSQALQGPFCGVIRAAGHERAVEVQQPVGIILLWWRLVADKCCRADQANGAAAVAVAVAAAVCNDEYPCMSAAGMVHQQPVTPCRRLSTRLAGCRKVWQCCCKSHRAHRRVLLRLLRFQATLTPLQLARRAHPPVSHNCRRVRPRRRSHCRGSKSRAFWPLGGCAHKQPGAWHGQLPAHMHGGMACRSSCACIRTRIRVCNQNLEGQRDVWVA